MGRSRRNTDSTLRARTLSLIGRAIIVGTMTMVACAGVKPPPPAVASAPPPGAHVASAPVEQRADSQSVVVDKLPAVDLKRDSFDYIPTVLGALTLLVAFVGGWISYKAFVDQRNAVRLTQRADVLIKSTELSPSGGLQHGSVITITFQNFGPTRADQLSLDIRIDVDGASVFSPGTLPVVALATGDTQPYAFDALNGANCRLADVQAGKATLKIVGRLSYGDVFKLKHHLDFVLKWDDTAKTLAIDQYDSA